MNGKRQGKGLDPDTINGGFIQEERGPRPVVKADEMEPGTPGVDSAEMAKARKVRTLKLAVMGINKNVLAKGDPAYRACVEMAQAYRKRRSMELSEMHGHVSIGASALLASASLAMAASRFLYEQFAKDAGGNLGTGMLKQAASLADSARQSELAAWEMSAREGLVKRKNNASQQGQPWLAQLDGDAKRGGRKTNAERQELSNNSVILEGGQEVFLPDA